MLIIGTADEIYRLKYVVKEQEWLSSPACTAAGLLSFVSSEVSAMVISLITLDRTLVLCLPLQRNAHLTGKFHSF